MPTIPKVIGKYQVVDRLGEGGMGTLYLGRDPALDRLVAIKVLRGDFDDEEMRERFSREARAISRLRHPNIVTIFEYGEFDGQPFIAMEYVAGESLAEIIARRAALTLTRKLRMLDELCAGMAYAHRARIVHRDLKPANIMVDSEGGLIKILDFGIARNLEASGTRFTQVVGTPRYMSPEQAVGGRVDHRSDIFAIGTVFYELLSYRHAFDGDHQIKILDKIANGEPTPLADVCPNLDASIVRIVSKALEKDAARRYQDLEAMRADIHRASDRIVEFQAESETTLPFSVPGTPVTPRPTDQLERRRASQIRIHLDQATQAIANGDYDGALEACEQVLLLDATNARAGALIEKARVGIEQRAIDAHLQSAREHLRQHALTEAEDALAEALKLRSNDPAIAALQRELQQARREAERVRERAAASDQAIARARACLADGAFESAVRAASEALAYVPDASEARTLKEQALAAIQQRAREEEARRRALDAVLAARRKFEAGQHTPAIEALQRFDPPHPEVQAALAELRAERDAIVRRRLAEEEERRLQLERQRQAARLEALLSDAGRRIDSAEFEAALRLLAEAERLDPRAAEIPVLRERATAARAAAEAAALRRRQIAAKLSAAATLLESSHPEEALAEVRAALAIDGGDDEARRLEGRIQAALAERRRLDDLERRARALADQARRQFDTGNVEDALSSLEQYKPPHPAVTAALRELRARADAAAHARAEEERRRQAEENARRAEQQRWLGERLAAARAALDRGDFGETLSVLNDVERRVPDASGVSQLREAAAAARGRAEEAERRRRDIERRLARARDRIADRAWADALQEIQGALAIERDHRAALDLQAAVNRAVDEQKRLDQEQKRLEEEARRERERRAAEKRRLDSIEAAREAVGAHLSRGEIGLAERGLVDAERSLHAEAELRDVRARLDAMRREQAQEPTVLAMPPTILEMAPTLLQMPTEAAASGVDTVVTPERREVRGARPSASRGPLLVVGASVAVLLIAAFGVLRIMNPPGPSPEPRPSDLAANRLPFQLERLPDVHPKARIDHVAPPIPETPIPKPPEPAPRPPGELLVEPPKPLKETRLGELFDQARGQLAQGRTDEALTSVVTALGLTADDRRFLDLLGEMFRQADTAASTAKVEADRVKASELASGGYGQAQGTLQAGRNRGASDRTGDAIRNLWRARDLFHDATTDAKAALARLPRPPEPDPKSKLPHVPSRAEVEAADKQAIDQVLTQYVAAYNSLNWTGVARLTSQPADQLKKAFANYRSYNLRLSEPQTVLDGDTATVTCVRQINVITTRGTREPHEDRATFKLRRSGSSWVIDSISGK